jgi:hypothetical protein
LTFFDIGRTSRRRRIDRHAKAVADRKRLRSSGWGRLLCDEQADGDPDQKGGNGGAEQ